MTIINNNNAVKNEGRNNVDRSIDSDQTGSPVEDSVLDGRGRVAQSEERPSRVPQVGATLLTDVGSIHERDHLFSYHAAA